MRRSRRCTALLIFVALVAVVVAGQLLLMLHAHRDRLWARPSRRCADLPVPPDHWHLADGSPAFVSIPNAAPIGVGGSVCVRVVVPPRPHNATVLYTPFPGTPWDSVLLDMVGNATNISVPVDLRPIRHVMNTERSSVHIYEADVVLRDADVYIPQGILEYRDAEWNPEMRELLVPYAPANLTIDDGLVVEAVEAADGGENPYSLSRHMELPLCTESSPEGRWVSIDDLPFDPSWVPLPDNNGRVWLPYACRLKRYSYERFAHCLRERYPVLHLFGDSNIRRMMKKLTTLGQWCSTPEQQATKACFCEDHEEKFDRFNVDARDIFFDIDARAGGWMQTRSFDLTRAPQDKARIYMRRWDGLTRSRAPWSEPFEKNITTFGRPQMAIVALTNWDAAFSPRAFYAQELERLLDFIESGFGVDTEIVVRTGQYYCCRHDESRTQRMYTRLRTKAFDQYIRDVFNDRFNGTRRISVWDVAAISERRPLEARMESIPCHSNHARSEVIEVENQVLFNYMCN
ncbi:hypothetical protein BX070DRAFT_235730 [Coemansia spiralis]|nr:hypothetical protein BX070DRAFT_235730 [Coemansia spiralis]